MARVATIQPVAERVSVLETKVENIDEKIDDLKTDVKDMHDCLDRTRDLLDTKLDAMMIEYKSNRDSFYKHANQLHAEDAAAHATLAAKIEALEKQKHKVIMYLMIGLAFAAGAGWFNKVDIGEVIKFFL